MPTRKILDIVTKTAYDIASKIDQLFISIKNLMNSTVKSTLDK